jgi:iron(III) transport system ATP-binding protein
VAELLDLVELREYAGRLPGTLSGGQQQRVALARSLAPNPSVLLLDEPFSALDAALRNQLRGDVRRIVREVGVTTVFVTHDQDEAFVMGDTIGVMQNGQLRQVGTPQELYARPTDRWVAEFVGEANVVEGMSDRGTASTVLGTVPLVDSAPDGRVEVLVRPEELRLVESGIEGILERLDFFGHDARAEVTLASGDRLIVRVPPYLRVPVGAPVGLAYAGRGAVAWKKP